MYNRKKEVTKLIRSKEIVSGKWLDVGCGLRPFEVLFPRGRYIGVDVEVSGANVLSKSLITIMLASTYHLPQTVLMEFYVHKF